MTKNTTTPIVRLRAMEPEDLDFVYDIENEQESWGESLNTVPFSRYLLHDYIANASADIYADKQVRMIIENDKGQAIGCADLFDFDPNNLRAEIGIIVHKEHRRKGYASSAMQSVMHYASTTIHLHQIYAIVGEHNEASLRLFSKLGFKPQATLNEWLYDGKNFTNAIIMQLFL